MKKNGSIIQVESLISSMGEYYKDRKGDIPNSNIRRLCGLIANIVGHGSCKYLSDKFRISYKTIQKGRIEARSGFAIVDSFNFRGRTSYLDKLPNLESDIKKIGDEFSQIDPKFTSTRLYTRLTAQVFLDKLISDYKYKAEELPKRRTISSIINELGFNLKRVQKTKPLKKIDETDAIFNNLALVHKNAENEQSVMRLSLDAKNTVVLGYLSRKGRNRLKIKVLDHDFSEEHQTPFGILNVKEGDFEISFTESKVTADFIADRLDDYLSSHLKPEIKTIIINLDNGPECNSHRTQFMKRIVDITEKHQVKIHLVYYPPYHSKYNPIERVWGTLEQHWNGDLLDCATTVHNFAKTVVYNGISPVVKFIEQVYKLGVKLTKEAMILLEKKIERMPGIEKWFVTVDPHSQMVT